MGTITSIDAPIWISQEELRLWLNTLDVIWAQLSDEDRQFLAAKLAVVRYAMERIFPEGNEPRIVVRDESKEDE